MVISSSVLCYTTGLEAWQHHPKYYLPCKKLCLKSPQIDEATSFMKENKPTILMLPEQQGLDNINQLFYGDPMITNSASKAQTSFICKNEPELLQKLILEMPSTLLYRTKIKHLSHHH